jgi:hypothetical protein
MAFTRGSNNTLNNLGIGRAYHIGEWVKERNITKYKINPDYSIDVNWSVDLKTIHKGNFPDYIQFNKVNGFFDCSDCDMTTLRGCPRNVLGSFKVTRNPLETLEFAPNVAAAIVCYNIDLAEHFRKHILNDTYKLKHGCY